MMPNLQALMPGETYSPDRIKSYPDRETAFAMTPERGTLNPFADHEFILSFSPHQVTRSGHAWAGHGSGTLGACSLVTLKLLRGLARSRTLGG